IPIATGIGYARNAAVVKSAQAVIAVGGSYGTLTEIGYALQSGLPVIGLNTWTISRNDRQDKSIIPAESPAEAVRLALELASD
ncbi:MAG TPA: TIGR00725 family protein, partial [Dehalococcoidia bacterium]|nr:TIGR00725 family protein [Dehalococcoidia bacterium]